MGTGWLAVALMATGAAKPASAAEEPGLAFYASYDKGFDADFSRGDPKAAVGGSARDGAPPRTTDGVIGQAVWTDRRGLGYAAAGHLKAASGTIALWFQPDWDPADEHMHTLFSTEMKPRCHLILYRYLRTKEPKGGIFGQFAFYIRGGDPADPSHSLVIPSSTVSDTWKRGQWHHVAAVWGQRSARLYVDGVLVAQAHGKLPGEEPGRFFVGGGGGGANRIDELRIYERALELPEIMALYVRGKRALALRRAEAARSLSAKDLGKTLKVGWLYQEGLQKLAVRVDATDLPIADLTPLRVRAYVRQGQEEPAGTVDEIAFSPLAQAQALLPVAGLPPGRHRLVVRVRDPQADKTVALWWTEIDRPEAQWLGNTIGRTDGPVAPFEAVQVAGDRIQVWGKHYELGSHLFLKQATVRPDPRAALHKAVGRFWREVSLLAEPIRLVGQFGGTEVRFVTAEVKAGPATKSHATFQAVSRQGPATATAALRFDDDSIITADVTLACEGPTPVRDLRLEIPLRTEYCRWMNWTSLDGHRDASGAGAIPAGQGVVWQGVFHPLLWLGDDYRGFGYFFDTSLGWTGDLTARDRVLIRRDGPTTTIVLRLSPESQTLTQPWRTKVSFLATPARPLPPRWRGMSLDGNFAVRHVPYKAGCPMHVVYWWTTAFFEQKQDHFSSPRVDTLRLEAIRAAIAKNGNEPISHVFYTFPNSYHHPMVKYFYSDWCNRSTEDLAAAFAGEVPIATSVDWNSSITDWWLHQMSQLADLGVDGIYCDDPYTHPSFNHRTGTAFIGPDGKVRPNYGLYGLRDYFRRLRHMLHQKANHPHLLLHMSNQLTLPFQIYFDSFANGEHLNQRLTEHYIGKLSTDEIRAQYLGYQWGNIPIILPELAAEFRQSVPATEEMLALVLPHDILVWVAWCHAATARAYNEALQTEFKTWADDCSFLPYWEAGDILRGQDAQLVASAYVRRDRALVIVANWGEAARLARLTVDWAVLTAGRPMSRARVLLNKGTAQVTDRTLSVEVPARNLRLVLLEP